MNRSRFLLLIPLLLSVAFPICWDAAVGARAFPYGAVYTDFAGLYYPARVFLHGGDPYGPGDSLRLYAASNGGAQPHSDILIFIFSHFIYPPATLILVSPFAALPWVEAHLVWTLLSAAALVLAACCVLELAGSGRSRFALLLACFLLANTEALFASGNPAPIAIGLAIAGVWTALRGRFGTAGMIALALALALKPQDAGLLWVFLLLAGSASRKRALQALAITTAFTLGAVAWLAFAAPEWFSELEASLKALSSGGPGDPATIAASIHGLPCIVNLDALLYLFLPNSAAYTPVGWAICAVIVVAWGALAYKSAGSPLFTSLAIAVAAPLALLSGYHRSYDLPLLLLVLPACAELGNRRRLSARLALAVTAVAFLATADMPLALLGHFTRGIDFAVGGVRGTILAAMLDRPVPLVLLLLCLYYIGVFWIERRAVPVAAESSPA